MIGAVLMGTGAVAHAQNAPTSIPQLVPVAVPTIAPAPAVPPVSGMPTATEPLSAKAAKKARLQEAVMKLENSLQVRVTNLEDIAMRVQSRIAKMQQAGNDTNAATLKLMEAQEAIAAAKTDLATLKKADVAMVASAKPLAAFANIKNKTAKNVVVKIKAAHKALVEVVVLIKGQGTPGAVPAAATSSTSTAR